MVEVLAAMVEAELAFFEVQVERVWMHAAEPCQPGLGIAPEAFDAVDVIAADAAAAELVACVIDTQVLLVAHVHKAVVALESVRVNDRAKVHFPSNRGQNRCFRAIFDDLGVDLAMPFADAEDDCLLAGTSASLALHTPWTEVAFINFDMPLEGLFQFASLGHALAQTGEQSVHRVAVQASKLRDLNSRQVSSNMPQELTENSL